MHSDLNPLKLREITREIVSGLIFSADNKLLMGKKDPKKGGVYANCWHIPGGGIDEGEDKIAALRREIREETNLDISKATIELIDDKGRGATEKVLKPTGEKVWCEMKFNVYEVRLTIDAKNITLNPSDDLIKLKWFDLSELSTTLLTPPSIELFKRLELLSIASRS